LVRFSRRALLCLAAPATLRAQPDDDTVREGRVLRWPRDHGAHPGARNEWWYATGWLERGGAPPIGFQVTFFRHRTGLAATLPGRFAARQLLFAHAALSDIAAQRHLQAQRLQRWSGDDSARDAHARRDDTDVRIGPWSFERNGDGSDSRYRALVGGIDATFKLTLELQSTQPLLLQGHGGHSRKGPLASQASHYYSLPHLRVQARVERPSGALQLAGSAWLDHEWSDEYLPPGAVGWDWIGINLDDGSALMAFRLRRADGSALWSGGSHRAADGRLRVFEDGQVTFTPQRLWSSAATQARYPVQWQLATPAGRFELRALMDAQELDGRGSNGAVYWEGLSDLLDEQGRRVGRGYLEMTGYAKPLAM
jgi:predicted secreted hydrolase